MAFAESDIRPRGASCLGCGRTGQEKLPDWDVYRRLLHLSIDDPGAFLTGDVLKAKQHLDDRMVRDLLALQRGISRNDAEVLAPARAPQGGACKPPTRRERLGSMEERAMMGAPRQIDEQQLTEARATANVNAEGRLEYLRLAARVLENFTDHINLAADLGERANSSAPGTVPTPDPALALVEPLAALRKQLSVVLMSAECPGASVH
jgi:hypothetical protein